MKLFVDQLTNVDFSYLHPERGLLGETWLAGIVLEGALDDQGMVCDFGIVKKVVRTWLDTELDHRLAVPLHSPHLQLEEHGDSLTLHWTLSSGEVIHCTSPRTAIALVEAEVLTRESVARWCEGELRRAFNDSVESLALGFDTESIDGAYYHYSHGLKKHAGNCQRIAHGHRSRIEVYADGERSPELETLWAERWRDIYIGTRADLNARPVINGVDYYTFTYRAAQGDFSLTLPRRCCYLIDTDSTVENLAQHILATTAREHPGQSWRVRAYEGAGKGAEIGKY